MAFTPWVTSETLIEDVKRFISFPLSQNTFDDNDVLAFANAEIKDELLPNLLTYHEEFFVTTSAMRLEPNRNRYPIPNRAVGMKLRDMFYGDGNTGINLPYGNLYDMTRINPDDKAWFGTTGVTNTQPYKFYLEGNDVVLNTTMVGQVTGFLVFTWFLRPNQLVLSSRAMILNGFSKTLTLTNSAIVAGDTITLTAYNSSISSTDYVFTAVAGAPSAFQFQIGGTSTSTATNLTSAINAQITGFTASNGGVSPTNIVKVLYTNRQNSLSVSNSSGFALQTTLNLESANTVPANITAGSKVDLLQTLPGHKTLNYDVVVPTNGVSSSTLTLVDSDVPTTMLSGDYVCSFNECIIPQIPPELHSSLGHRTSARILSAIGDKEGLAVEEAHIAKIEAKESALVDNRVDGAPMKILNRQGLLRNMSRTRRGRF